MLSNEKLKLYTMLHPPSKLNTKIENLMIDIQRLRKKIYKTIDIRSKKSRKTHKRLREAEDELENSKKLRAIYIEKELL